MNHPFQAARFLAAALGIALAATAQANLTAHPQDSLNGRSANYGPFGVSSTGSGAEARTQLLVPKDELPNAGTMLTGIGLLATSGSVDYASLEIRASATTATSLSNLFASNVVGPETVVLQATSLRVTYSSTAWMPIAFTQPYVHDGTSALLLDIRKVVQTAPSYSPVTMRKNSQPPHRPAMVLTLGGPGSGASTRGSGSITTSPISFRLEWSGAPTVRHVSDAQYALGSTVALTVNGTAGSLWLLGVGTGFLTPSATIPGVRGTFRLDGPVIFAIGLLNATGEAIQNLNIPNRPNLVGLYLAYQGATQHPVTGEIVLTNGTDFFIN